MVTGENFIAGESHNVTTWQHDETKYQDDYDNNTTRVSKNETLSKTAKDFNDVAIAVCKRLTQNSPRQLGHDPTRQLDSRSDSRDSGLGKESEVDYERGLVNRNNVALLSGALDSGVSSPRVMSDRSSRSSRVHPLTLGDPGLSFPWRPDFPSQTIGSSDSYESKAFVKERFASNGFVGDRFQDRVQPPPLMYPDDRRPRSAKSTGFNQINGRRPSTGFNRSQGRRFDVPDVNNDLSRTTFCGNENNFSLLTQSTGSALPTHWTGSQSSNLSPAGLATANTHKTQAGLLRATGHTPPNDLHLSNFDHFPNDSKWPSLANDRTMLDREYSNRMLRFGGASNRRHRLQTPSPAPNCQFELNPGYPSTFLNHPLCGFTPNLRFNSYPSHLFGGAPSFHSISNSAFPKDRTNDFHQRGVSTNRFGYAAPTEEPLFQQQSKRCDARLLSHTNHHRR